MKILLVHSSKYWSMNTLSFFYPNEDPNRVLIMWIIITLLTLKERSWYTSSLYWLSDQNVSRLLMIPHHQVFIHMNDVYLLHILRKSNVIIHYQVNKIDWVNHPVSCTSPYTETAVLHASGCAINSLLSWAVWRM